MNKKIFKTISLIVFSILIFSLLMGCFDNTKFNIVGKIQYISTDINFKDGNDNGYGILVIKDEGNITHYYTISSFDNANDYEMAKYIYLKNITAIFYMEESYTTSGVYYIKDLQILC